MYVTLAPCPNNSTASPGPVVGGWDKQVGQFLDSTTDSKVTKESPGCYLASR